MQHHAAPMSPGFKVGGSGSSDADDGLRDGIEMEESRPDNLKEVVSRRKCSIAYVEQVWAANLHVATGRIRPAVNDR